MIAAILALVAAIGVFYVYSSLAFGWEGMRPGPKVSTDLTERRRLTADEWMVQAGLDDVGIAEFTAVVVALFVVGFASTFVIFGGWASSLTIGVFAGSFPVASYRSRRRNRRARAAESWPRMIEEIRILTSSLGRSIPQALFEVGERGPDELQHAFRAAHREWLISTDFARTIAVLKQRLADPTADATCETLLIAHELGGTDLDQRLAALAEDRTQDTQGRKDARARQAGVRFARRFVLFVPFGMALAGASVGSGRDAYGTPAGQAVVLTGIALVVVCWLWAGRIMRLPDEDRVFQQ